MIAPRTSTNPGDLQTSILAEPCANDLQFADDKDDETFDMSVGANVDDEPVVDVKNFNVKRPDSKNSNMSFDVKD